MNEVVRVCVIYDGCTRLTVPAKNWKQYVDEIQDLPEIHQEDEQRYTIIFKNMNRQELESLPEFGGF